MKIKQFAFLLFFGIQMSISQESLDVIPPSPEAASLGKFTEVPVSLYSGLANISIPITSFEVEGRSFPISLAYHSRGIKVNEMASRIGIGWALSSGGAISRQIRHVADDESPYGYLKSGNSLIPKLASNQSSTNWFTSNTTRNNFISQSSSIEEATDRIPDSYSLQAGGVSAKFIMDYKTPYKPILQKYDDLEVTYVLGTDSQDVSGERIISFKVVDAQGFIYYFGISKDGSRYARNWDKNLGNYSFPLLGGGYNLSPSESSFKTYNTWQLMDIESPNGELASFYYKDEISRYFRRSYDKKENDNNVINYSSKVESHQYQLRKIVHRGGEIVFEKSLQSREDLFNGYALDKIIIKDYNLNFVKSFTLNHSYQEDTQNNTQNNALLGLEPKASKRLFLDAVVEQGKNGATKPPHILTYSNIALPNRFSNAQDYWGYYNAANNGQFLTFSNYGSHNIDRRVDVDKSMAGMLTQITYPTGGYTKFTYEHNKGIMGYDFRQIKIPEVNPINTEGNYNAFLGHLMYLDSTNYDGHVYSKTFTINNFVNGSFTYDIWYSNPTGCSETVFTGDCRFNVTLKKLGGTTYNLLNGMHTINSISSGTYTLTVDPVAVEHDPIHNTDDHFTASVRWKEAVNESETYASGKRIKSVDFYDSDGSLASFKEYEYEQGSILGISSFHSIQNTPSSSVLESFFILEPLGAIPGSPLSTYQGNNIGYPFVTEYYGNKDVNIGKNWYRFSFQEDTGDYTSFPYHPPTDNEWLRGLPLTTKNYRKEPGEDNYTLVKQTDFEYIYGNSYEAASNLPLGLPLIFTPLTSRLDINENMMYGNALTEKGLPYVNTNEIFRLPLIHIYYPPEDLDNATNAQLDYKVYYFTGGTLHQYSSKDTYYYEDADSIINRTQNSYNYTNHYQPVEVLKESSDGESNIQVYTYPQDFVNATGAIDSLKNQNRHVPIEVKSYKDTNKDDNVDATELLNTIKTTYSWLDNILEPTLIQSAKGTSPFVDKINYHKYNVLGNPLEVSQAYGAKTSYIWGYNNMYPIAKIENASYAEIALALSISETVLKSFNESNLTLINSLRNNTALSNAMISTYTYTPSIGLTSMTDPKGYTITYIYDDHNRLIEVRDQDNKLISENKYYYKNQ